MATSGIVRRHSRHCRSRDGGRCNCGAGWQAWVYLLRERKKVYATFRLESEAKTWRTDAQAAANRGVLRATKRDTRTVADALTELIAGMRAGTVRPKGRKRYKPATVRSYEQHVRLYVAPSELGAMKVAEVRRADVQALADELLADGLAPGTVANVLCPLQTFYRRALDRDELAYNPAERIELPTDGPRRAQRIASPSEAAALIAALEEDDRPLWATAFYAGLRRGELMALRVLDIDLGASVISVERGWDQYEGEQDPKSYAGRRIVPLLAVLRDFLDEHLLRSGRSGDDLVFGRTASAPFSPTTIGKRSKRAWATANENEDERAEREGREAELLEPITLHDARHCFASMAIDAGITNAKAIQEAMGHAKVQTVWDLYGHLLPGGRDEMRERMDAYLEGAVEDALDLEDDHDPRA